MKTIKVFQILAITVLIISGCSNENLNPDFDDIPVVEGYLYAGQSIEINISRQFAYSEEVVYSSDNLDSLDIKLVDGNLYYDLLPIGNGRYTHPDINVDEWDMFELEFYYNNLLVSAQTSIPGKPENFQSTASDIYVSDDIFTVNSPDELVFTWDNPDGSYYYLLIENTESNPTPIYDNDNTSSINQFFKPLPTQLDNYSMKTRRFTHYGNHRVILFHINPDLATLYEEGDNTSQNISNPPSDLSNAFGVFSGINADTLYLNVLPN